MSIVKELSTDAFSLEDLLRAPETEAAPSATTRAQRQLQLLLKVSEALSDPSAAATLPDQIVRLLPQIVPVERAVLVLAKPEAELAVEAAHSTVPAPTGMFSRQIAGYVLEKGVAVLSVDALNDARFDASGSIGAQSIRASMCAPLRGRERPLGVLYADNVTHAEIFGEDELRLLVGFANQAAIALENAALTRQLAEAAKARERELMVLVDERTGELRAALEQAQQATREADQQRAIAEEANDTAQEASKAKSRFLASMSHELRTPLNGIIGYAEILHEESEEEGRTQNVADLMKIEAAARHLLSLINDILDLSKIEAGKMELLLHDFDLGAAIGEVVATVTPLMERRGNQLVVRLPDTLGQIFADETRLRQVLYNLLSNASKFTEGGTITLDVERAPREGEDWLTLRVIDTGIGMTDAQLGRLFQAFSQAEADTSRKYGGTGLGLAISRQFCRMMGGDVTVTSTHGKGSTFAIEIPARVSPVPAS